ncbi:hypothetical protein IAT38_005703 [Cryptococcus sp. DSM 104549]
MSNATDAAAVLEASIEAIVAPHKGIFLGPVMIAAWFDMVLCGVMIKQLITWWQYAVEDRTLIRIIVIWSTICGLIGTIFDLSYIFQIFVYSFGRYTPLADPESWKSWLGVIASLTSAGVQVFYTHRVYMLTRQNKILAAVLLFLVAASVAGGIGSKITTKNNDDPVAALKAEIFIYLYTSAAVVADAIITGVIMWCLGHSKSGWRATDRVVSKMLAVAVETQFPPTIMAVAFLVVFAYKMGKTAAHPDEVIIDVTSNLTGFFMMVMPKTYVVGFLAVLNSRTALRAVMSAQHDPTQFDNSNNFPLRNRPLDAGQIKVTTDTYVHASEGDPASHTLSSMSPATKPPRTQANAKAMQKLGITLEDDDESVGIHGLDFAEYETKSGLEGSEGSSDLDEDDAKEAKKKGTFRMQDIL